MTKVLILGAGTYQIPLIRRAMDSGLWVAVASWKMSDPGMSLAHEAWEVDTTDKERLLERARAKGIEAVVTTGTDVAVPSIGYLCDHLDLPGIDHDTALGCTNKVLMQERFTAGQVPAAAWQRVAAPAEARQAAEAIGLPVIVKAPDSSGSRGVTVVQEPGGLAAAFEAARKVSRSGEVLVEELLTGEEFGAQVIVQDGQVAACLCHNDTVTPPPITVPIGHSCPSRLPAPVQAEAADVCAAAIRALGIRDAVCNADLIATASGVRVFEIGARVGATGLPEIIRLHHGVDLYDLALRMALGQRPKVEVRTGQPASAVLMIRAPATGTLVRCRAPRAVAEVPGVVSVKFDCAEGASVRQFRTGPDRIGDVLVVSADAASAEALARRVAGLLDIEVQPTD